MTTNLNHIDTWLFDLDNTLYSPRLAIYSQIDQRMGEFLVNTLQLEPSEARKIQKDYYYRYGSTLTGLIKHHQISPKAFWDYVYAIDLTPLTPNPTLNQTIGKLPGRKFVFTNASRQHALNVLHRLRLSCPFSDIFSAEHAHCMAKSSPDCFDHLIKKHHIKPQNTVLFDDMLVNLKTASALSMTTVWVTSTQSATKTTVDFTTHSLLDWLKQYLETHHVT